METVQYILDFFFGDFWHFLGLCILLLCVGHKGEQIIQENHIEERREEDRDG
jgi:hypothetical protein